MSQAADVKRRARRGAAALSAKPRRRAVKWGHLLFVLPAVALTLVFFVYPLLQALVMSFYDWELLGERRFVGLSNYAEMTQDGLFWSALWFTARYTLLVTPLLFFVALGLAVLIRKHLPGNVFFRSVYFLPVVISLVSASLVWKWIFNDLYGVLNHLLQSVGLIGDPVLWLGRPETSLPAISFMITWKMAGFTMVILLAGLQGIPEEVYEAGNVDGTTRWQSFWYITLPLLRPAAALSLIVSVIGSVLAFEQFLIMTQGGPSNETTTAVQWIYETSFAYFQLGYGSALTFVLLAILIALSLLQLRVVRDQTGT